MLRSLLKAIDRDLETLQMRLIYLEDHLIQLNWKGSIPSSSSYKPLTYLRVLKNTYNFKWKHLFWLIKIIEGQRWRSFENLYINEVYYLSLFRVVYKKILRGLGRTSYDKFQPPLLNYYWSCRIIALVIQNYCYRYFS